VVGQWIFGSAIRMFDQPANLVSATRFPGAAEVSTFRRVRRIRASLFGPVHRLRASKEPVMSRQSQGVIFNFRFGMPETGSMGGSLDVAAVHTIRHSLQVMASSRPTSTNMPPAPEKDQPAPTTRLSDAPKIALPNNIAQTLQFLCDDDLETLRVSVDSELERRRPTSARPNARKASAAQPAAAAPVSRGRHGELDSGTAIPAGRASLIKASYQAGMKPVAIARSLRVSLSIVNRVLITESKARR
jgi:hypothetical protein